MTEPIDPLQAPLRFLRDAPLPLKFDERLAQCLAAANASNVVPLPRRQGRRRVALLVAAIAIPAAAFTSGGWFFSRQSSSNSTASIHPSRVPEVAKQRDLSAMHPLPATSRRTPTGVLPLEASTVDATPNRVESPKSLSRQNKVSSNSGTVVASPSAHPHLEAHSLPTRRHSSDRASIPLLAPPLPPVPEKIEALDFKLPNQAPRTTEVLERSPAKASTATELRSMRERGPERTPGEREPKGARPDGITDHRSRDATQQVRERVHSRERRGQ